MNHAVAAASSTPRAFRAHRQPFRLVVPWLALSLTLLSLVLQLDATTWALGRDAVSAGEVHRLFTGHFVHYGRAHVIGDVLAFAFWAAALEQCNRRLLAITVFASTLLSSLVVLAWYPSISEYRGLSVVDCALAAELLLLGVFNRSAASDHAGTTLFGVALGLFALKTLYELAAGRAVLAPDLGTGVALLPVLHVVGIGVGTALVAGPLSITRRCRRTLP